MVGLHTNKNDISANTQYIPQLTKLFKNKTMAKKGAAFHKSAMTVTKDGLQCTPDGERHYKVDGLVMLSHPTDEERLDIIKPTQHVKDGMLEYHIYDDDSESVEDFTDGFLDGWIETSIYGFAIFVGAMLALGIYKLIF